MSFVAASWAVLGSDGLRFDRFTVGELISSALFNQNSHLTMAWRKMQDVDVDLLREPKRPRPKTTRLLS